MVTLNYTTEKRLFEAAERDRKRNRLQENAHVEALGEQIREGEVDIKKLSVKRLFETFVEDATHVLDAWRDQRAGSSRMMEAAVETSQFSNITGQIFYNRTMQAFDNPELIGNRLVETIDTDLEYEKIAGVSLLSDDIETVGESDPYPTAGVSEDWVETPITQKRGFIVPVTKEAILFDKTRQLLDRCGAVSQTLAVNKEKRILDCVLGVTSSYNRKSRGVVATYGDNSGDHDFDNLQASNALQDWTDVEAAWLLFDGMTDPNTGEPIMIGGELQLIVPSALKATAMRILAATEYRHVANSNTTIGGNPLQYIRESLTLESNAYVKARTSSASTWFVGNFPMGFKYMQNWGPTVIEAPVNSEDDFKRDIVSQYKVTERGVAAAVEPRYAVKCTA